MFVECRIKRQPTQMGPAPINIWAAENCTEVLSLFGVVIFTHHLCVMSCQIGSKSVEVLARVNLKLLS